MKKLLTILLLGVIMTSCTQQKNPFLQTWNTPFGTPPFDKIQEKHYIPAYLEGMKQQMEEVDAIINNSEDPTFENTLEALDNSGKLLNKVDNVFSNLNSSTTNDELQKIAKEVSPLLSKHFDDISMNDKLFARIKAVYDKRDQLELDTEQFKLLEKSYKDAVRGGALLNDEQKDKLRAINAELSKLSLQFGENVLKENNEFKMVLDKKEDLAGLPASVIAAAEEAAKEHGEEGKWVFTLHKPSLIPFLQFSDKREYREIMLKGYIERGNHNNELDNKDILKKMASLRVKRANLLGYETHAHYILEKNMAKEPENVYELLWKLWKPALNKAKAEAYDLQAMINKEGGDFKLEPWDWWYYAEKIKKEKYELNEEELRPYFQLENVRDGAFAVANKLYGITFTELQDVKVYHPDVKVFEVKDADGSHVGVLYTDYFPRASKRGGAWMSSFRKQSNNGEYITPLITNTCNFTKPTADTPSLLSLEEVSTLFHEFGHALHGLLSDCKYNELSGTSVSRDFVELPSQIMENWASEPEVMKSFAKHYKTGETIPDDLLAKIENAGKFNQGFATVEYLAASFLDMDWHTLAETKEHDVDSFENASMQTIGLIPEIVVRYKSPYFRHIFAGGYSSGYYSYIWAEVLDADAFQAFKENGIFDRETAMAFRNNVLAKGGSEDPMKLYVKFRGQEPDIKALLERRGLN